MIFMQMTCGKRVIPSPHKEWGAWVGFSLFGANKAGKELGKAVSYQTCRERIKPLLINADICTSKVCHAFRAGGAKAADLMG